MIKKTENCLYCGEKMESITAKKKFCSDLHRVYWNRENKLTKIVTAPEVVEVKEKAFEEIVVKGKAFVGKKVKENKKESKVIPKKAPVSAQNEPKEGSMAFHLKYGAFTYAELKNK